MAEHRNYQYRDVRVYIGLYNALCENNASVFRKINFLLRHAGFVGDFKILYDLMLLISGPQTDVYHANMCVHAVLFDTVTALFLSVFIVQQNARQYSTYSPYVPTCFDAVPPSSVGRSNFHLKNSNATWYIR
jgi:hypothetical protein